MVLLLRIVSLIVGVVLLAAGLYTVVSDILDWMHQPTASPTTVAQAPAPPPSNSGNPQPPVTPPPPPVTPLPAIPAGPYHVGDWATYRTMRGAVAESTTTYTVLEVGADTVRSRMQVVYSDAIVQGNSKDGILIEGSSSIDAFNRTLAYLDAVSLMRAQALAETPDQAKFGRWVDHGSTKETITTPGGKTVACEHGSGVREDHVFDPTKPQGLGPLTMMTVDTRTSTDVPLRGVVKSVTKPDVLQKGLVEVTWELIDFGWGSPRLPGTGGDPPLPPLPPQPPEPPDGSSVSVGGMTLTLIPPGPASIVQGGRTPIVVKVVRAGFDAAINLDFSQLPTGVTIAEQQTTIARGATQASFTLQADGKAPVETGQAARVSASGGGLKVGPLVFRVDVTAK